jgi:hypothetical protein
MTATRAGAKRHGVADTAFRDQNAALLIDLGHAIIDDPSILEQIPNGAMLVLLPTNAEEAFIERSIETGLDMLRQGHNVYFRHLAPGEWSAADFVSEEALEDNGSG